MSIEFVYDRQTERKRKRIKKFFVREEFKNAVFECTYLLFVSCDEHSK